MGSLDRNRFNWGLPLSVAAAGSIVLLSLTVYSPYGDLLYILIIAPIVCLVCLFLMVMSAIRKRPRQCVSALLTLVAFVAASGALHTNRNGVRLPSDGCYGRNATKRKFWRNRLQLAENSGTWSGKLRDSPGSPTTRSILSSILQMCSRKQPEATHRVSIAVYPARYCLCAV